MPEASPPPTNFAEEVGGKYDIQNMTYPTELAGDEESMNFVKFWICVQEDAKISKYNNIQSNTIPNRAVGNTLVGAPITKTSLGVAQTAVATATGALGGVAKGATEYGTKGVAGLASNISGGALLTGGAQAVKSTAELGALNSVGINFGKVTKRLQTAIQLYTPNQLSVRYGTSWGEEDVGIAAALAANVNGSVSSMQAQGKPVNASSIEGLENGAAAVGGAAKSATAAFVLSQNAGYSALSRTAVNPRKEQVFKGVDYRRFTFEYQFAPRSPEEAQSALNIIYLFKYHMHPEFKSNTGNFIYIYPSEFDIEYYIGGEQNSRIHKHSSCVLTEMNVNYAPNGIFNTFDDGTPTMINLTLNFTELEMLTKERIVKGL